MAAWWTGTWTPSPRWGVPARQAGRLPGHRVRPHVALLHSESHFYANSNLAGPGSFHYADVPMRTINGALQLLLQNHYHTDVLNEDALLRRMDLYPVIVVAEQTSLAAGAQRRAHRLGAAWWAALLTGSHVAQDYGDILGVTPDGDPAHESVYVPARAAPCRSSACGSVSSCMAPSRSRRCWPTRNPSAGRRALPQPSYARWGRAPLRPSSAPLPPTMPIIVTRASAPSWVRCCSRWLALCPWNWMHPRG